MIHDIYEGLTVPKETERDGKTNCIDVDCRSIKCSSCILDHSKGHILTDYLKQRERDDKMEVLQGFKYADGDMNCSLKTILFMDAKGKDGGINRYRIELYYGDGRAVTHFEPSIDQYYMFLSDHCLECYETYEEFKQRKTNKQRIAQLHSLIEGTEDDLNKLHKELVKLQGGYNANKQI